MDGTNKLQNGSSTVYKLPNTPGCGKYVFFRVLANIGLVSSTTGQPAQATCFPPNDITAFSGGTANAVGGIVVLVHRHYNIEAPAGFEGKNTFVINNNIRVPAGSTYNNEVDEDMPYGGPVQDK